MLDVHPPHEKMHGFKDFLLHLFTITIGLLIALGLEGYAEHWKQRELKKDADTKLRQEIRDNAKEMALVHNANVTELDARRTLVRLTAMDQVGTALAKEYDAVLKSN